MPLSRPSSNASARVHARISSHLGMIKMIVATMSIMNFIFKRFFNLKKPTYLQDINGQFKKGQNSEGYEKYDQSLGSYNLI